MSKREKERERKREREREKEAYIHKIQIPIKIWCKIFDSVIMPIPLYGCDMGSQ